MRVASTLTTSIKKQPMAVKDTMAHRKPNLVNNLGVKNLGAGPMKLANHRAFFAGNMMFLGGLLDLSLADDCLLQEA